MVCIQLADLLANDLVVDLVFTHLTLADVCRLHGVCRSVRSVLHPLLYDRLSINAALKNFVTNCDAFRRALGKADGLIVGEFVLNFLFMQSKDSLILDILVERDYFSEVLVTYLCAEEAFEGHESGEVSSKLGRFGLIFTDLIRLKQSFLLDQNLRQKSV